MRMGRETGWSDSSAWHLNAHPATKPGPGGPELAVSRPIYIRLACGNPLEGGWRKGAHGVVDDTVISARRRSGWAPHLQLGQL